MRRCSSQSIRLAMGRRFLSLRPWMSGRKRICSWMSGRTQEERCLVRKGRRELDDLGFALAEFHHGWIGGGKIRSSHPEAGRANAKADPEPHQAGRNGGNGKDSARDTKPPHTSM